MKRGFAELLLSINGTGHSGQREPETEWGRGIAPGARSLGAAQGSFFRLMSVRHDLSQWLHALAFG
ncbi:hypothetical protein [Ferrimonas pelagia]|uniref:hypothetical protein n=1 Tax=Ferrimonas pelagia TaxID=1177826 RepID=UPI0031ECB1D2